MLCFPILLGSVQAERIVFTGEAKDECWTNEANWVYYKSNPVKRGVPTEADEVRLNSAQTARITVPVRVGYLKLGANGLGQNGKVIIDGGSLVTVGLGDYNSAGQNASGTLIVTNGGSAVFNSRFNVGNSREAKGLLFIEGGSVRVAGPYNHYPEYSGPEAVLSRTVIGEAGLLDVNALVLNGGVMDVAGGTVIVRAGRIEQINQWVAEGRIIAMGDLDGWKIKAAMDPATGYLLIVAEPSSDPKPPRKPAPSSDPAPLSVGMLSPDQPVSSAIAG